MQKLNYTVLEESGYDGYILKNAPEKVLQFGEGNFLRAFVNYWFDVSNEKAGWNGKCCLVQPISQGLTKLINEQDGLYTLYLRGTENGQKVDRKRVISSVSRCLNPYEEADFAAMMEVAASDDLEYYRNCSVFSVIIEIKHGGHSINTQTVNMEFIQPEHCA